MEVGQGLMIEFSKLRSTSLRSSVRISPYCLVSQRKLRTKK